VTDLIVISVVLPFIVFVVGTAASLLLAQRKNNELAEQSPDVLPYIWGYFLGYSGIIVAVLASVAGVALLLGGYYRDWLPIIIAYAVASGIASYGVLLRRKWGWLLHIPLSLNMGLWAFNSVYVHNRWREF